MKASNFEQWNLFDQCINVNLTPLVKEQLNNYYQLLVQENEKYNLTRIIDETDFYYKHIFDCLLFTNQFNLNQQKVADIGSGAGFPGIVLKIFFPQLTMVLIEANQKKVNFLKLVINTLDLEGIEVVSDRAEQYSVLHQEEFEIIVSRAVAYLDIILELGVQMLKVEGTYILLKGPRAEEEITRSGNLAEKLNLKLVNKQVLVDKYLGVRVNLFYQKLGKTPRDYPRSYRVIKKSSGGFES